MKNKNRPRQRLQYLENEMQIRNYLESLSELERELMTVKELSIRTGLSRQTIYEHNFRRKKGGGLERREQHETKE